MKSNLKVCKVTVTYKSKTIIVNYFRFQLIIRRQDEYLN